jgi:hypothetical protein
MSFIYSLTYYLSFGYYNPFVVKEQSNSNLKEVNNQLNDKFLIVENRLNLGDQIANFKFKNKVNINENKILKDIITVRKEDMTYDNLIDEMKMKMKIKEPLKKTVYTKPEIKKRLTILDEIHAFKFETMQKKPIKKIKID